MPRLPDIDSLGPRPTPRGIPAIAGYKAGVAEAAQAAYGETLADLGGGRGLAKAQSDADERAKADAVAADEARQSPIVQYKLLTAANASAGTGGNAKSLLDIDAKDDVIVGGAGDEVLLGAAGSDDLSGASPTDQSRKMTLDDRMKALGLDFRAPPPDSEKPLSF